jgi:uncharacterized protein
MPILYRVSRRTLLLLLAAASIVTAATTGAVAEIDFPEAELVVESSTGSHRFTVELALTPEQQRRGLMFRRELADDRGMLFDFGTERPVTMWMRNTYIPLDMIFIRADGTIHHIAEDTTPLSDATIVSRGPVRAVLEVNAGTAERLGIAPGDRVRHEIFE